MQRPINRKAYMQEIRDLADEYLLNHDYGLVQRMKDLILDVAHDHVVYGTPMEVSKECFQNDGYRDE